MKLIIALALLALAQADWEQPMEVLPFLGLSQSIYTDASNGVSHVIWCDFPYYSFYYRRLYPNNTLSPIVPLKWKYPCRDDYTIQGADDGKSVYLVFEGRRARKERRKDCADDEESCHDVFFSESLNGGDKWSDPIPIPRAIGHDRENRLQHTLLSTAKGRLWIFYRLTGLLSGRLAYVMRAPGAANFGLENRLPVNVSKYSVTHTVRGGSSKIAVHFSDGDSNETYRYYTDNNGIQWHGPSRKAYCGADRITDYPFNSVASPAHIFLLCSTKFQRHYMRVSKDDGGSFANATLAESALLRHFTIASDGKGDGIIAYGMHTISFMKFDGKEFNELDPPPLRGNPLCSALTSSYKLGKYFFWHIHFYDDGQRTLWVAKADMIKESLTTS